MKFKSKSQREVKNKRQNDSFSDMEITAEEGLSDECKKWIRAQALNPCGHACLRITGRRKSLRRT